MLAIPFILLLALLGLGSLAAFVFGIVYAIVNKRPGVALAAVLAPVGVLAGAVLLIFLVRQSAVVVQSSEPVKISWAVNHPMPQMPSMPPMPPMPPMPSASEISVSGRPASWAMLAAIVLACFAVVKLIRGRAGCSKERGGGWGKALVVTVLLLVAAKFLWLKSSYDPRRVAQGRAEAAQRKVTETQRQLEEAQENAAQKQIDGMNLEQLWEKLNESRIKLEANDQGASVKMGAGPGEIAIVAPAHGSAKVIVPLAEKSPESLARSLARLERMVQQVSAVADQVSDAGTLIGKAIIVLNETLDSPRSAAGQPQAKAQAVAAVVSKKPAAIEATTAVQARAAAAVQEQARTETDSVGETKSSVELISEHSPNAESNPDRPAWTDDPPQRVGNTWREVVVTEEYATADECARAADVYLLLKTYEHFQQLQGMPHGDNSLPSLTFRAKDHWIVSNDGRVIYEQHGTNGVWKDERIRNLEKMGIGIDFIRREMVPRDREYLETVERSFGPMKKLYTMLEFTPSVDAELHRRWDELRREDRFAAVGAGAGSVLGLIGLAFGLLKVDTWTKGYYTKRLFLGVPAAIIGLVVLLARFAGP